MTDNELHDTLRRIDKKLSDKNNSVSLITHLTRLRDEIARILRKND